MRAELQSTRSESMGVDVQQDGQKASKQQDRGVQARRRVEGTNKLWARMADEAVK